MNKQSTFRISALSLALALTTLSGCSTLSKLLGNSDGTETRATAAASPLPPAFVASPLEINRTAERGCTPTALAVLAAQLPDASQQAAITQSVFLFGTDKYDLTTETTGVLAAHSLLLQKQTALRLKITGHTDERGTADYNLALGERRANTVAAFLATAGVKSEQLQVISYGEEKPVAVGSDEAAWAQNRRVELSYSGCAQ